MRRAESINFDFSLAPNPLLASLRLRPRNAYIANACVLRRTLVVVVAIVAAAAAGHCDV